MLLSASEVINKMKDSFGENILDAQVREQKEGVRTEVIQRILVFKIDKGIFYKFVKTLREMSPLHIATSMNHLIHDETNEIELIHFFTMNFGGGDNFKEMTVLVHVNLPKDDFRLPTITDIVPGAIIMEREAKEMLGLDVENIPDGRRLFTPNNLDEKEPGMLPMRDDLGFGYDDYYAKHDDGDR